MQIIDAKQRKANIYFEDHGFKFILDLDWAKTNDYPDLVAANSVCDEKGNVYVATRNKEYPLLYLDKDGNVLKSFGQDLLDTPHCLFYTKDKTLLCTDSGALHVIREISTDGKVLRDFGSFKQPSDSGYDPDAAKKLVEQGLYPQEKLNDPTFVIRSKLNSIQRAAEPFNKPTKMIVARNGQYFASDGYRNAAIHHFDKDGNYLKTWGGPGTEAGQFRLPHSIAEDDKERLWVADRENDRLQVFDHDGNLLAVINNLLQPSEIYIDKEYIYVGESKGGITILDYNYQIVCQIGYPGSILRCHGFNSDGNGNFYICALWINGKNTLLRLRRI